MIASHLDVVGVDVLGDRIIALLSQAHAAVWGCQTVSRQERHDNIIMFWSSKTIPDQVGC